MVKRGCKLSAVAKSGRARRPKHLRAKVGDVVKVTWRDHCTHGTGWRDLDDAKEYTDLECTSFGQVIRSDEGLLNIVQTISAEDQVFGVFTIVRGTIIRIEVLS